MKSGVSVDDKDVLNLLKRMRLTTKNMLDIANPTALTIVNSQRTLVPVDTAATKNSVFNEVIISTKNLVVEHVGPTTNYAPGIEFGITSKPNYPIQPFVRPSIGGVFGKRALKVADTNFNMQIQKKIKRSVTRARASRG